MAEYQDYYSQYSSANSKNDEQGGGGGTTGGATEATLIQVRDRLPSDGTFDSVLADGADITQGAIADAPAAAGGTGTISAKLRLITTQLNSISGFVDQLETFTDGLETLIGTTNTSLSAISGYVDQLETYTDQLEGLMTFSKGSGAVDVNTIRVALSTDGIFATRIPGIIAYQPGTTYSATHYGIPQLYRTVDPTAPPTYTAGQEVLQSCDLNGAALANTRSLIPSRDSVATVPVAEAAVATISVTSTSTTYVRSTTIDLTGYNTITILPNVTAGAGTTGYYKISWSEDAGANWFDETSDTLGASGTPAAGEKLVTQDVVVRQFTSGSTGFKSASACTLTKRARYLSISQKSDAAVTVTTAYNYQRF